MTTKLDLLLSWRLLKKMKISIKNGLKVPPLSSPICQADMILICHWF